MISGLDLFADLAILSSIVTIIVLVRRRVPFWRSVVLLGFVVYLSGVAGVTLGGIPIGHLGVAPWERSVAYNVVPFATIRLMMRSGMIDLVVYQIGGNLLLLAPLGFILPVLSARFERFRATLATVFGVSLGIEVLQLVASLLLGFAWKSFDVDDLILNTIGGVAGWIAIRLFMAAGGRRAVRRLRAAR